MKRYVFLFLFVLHAALAECQTTKNHVFEFAIAPNTLPEQITAAQTVISDLILKEMVGGDILTVVDALSFQRVFSLTLDPRIDGRKPAMRQQLIGKLHPNIRQLRMIFARLKSKNTSDSLNLLQYLRSDIRPEERPKHNYHLIWIGSPIIHNPGHPLNDMSNGYGNDAHFNAEQSIWSTRDMRGRLQGVNLHIFYDSSLRSFTNVEGYKEQHRKKIGRMYAGFMQLSGGKLLNYGSSIDILSSLKTANFTPITVKLDMSETEPMTYEFQANTISNGAILGSPKIWKAATKPPTPLNIDDPTINTKGPIMIGLRYDAADNPDLDLDLITQLTGDAEISFRTMGQEVSKYGGQLIKDFSSASLNSFGHETVLYGSEEADLRRLKVVVNHFGGKTNKPIVAQVRILHNGIVYKKNIELTSRVGDGGTSDRAISPNFKVIDVREVVGMPSSLSLQNVPPVVPISTPDKAEKQPFSKGTTFLKSPEIPAEIVVLVDLSGSMQTGVGNSFLEKVTSFFKGKTRSEVALHGLKNFLKENPQHHTRIATYSTRHCSEDIQLYSSPRMSFDAIVSNMESRKGQSEQLIKSLLNASQYFDKNSRVKRIYVIGDADDACNSSSQSLCEVVENLQEVHNIEVSFYGFALAEHNLSSHPCLRERSTQIR